MEEWLRRVEDKVDDLKDRLARMEERERFGHAETARSAAKGASRRATVWASFWSLLIAIVGIVAGHAWPRK